MPRPADIGLLRLTREGRRPPVPAFATAGAAAADLTAFLPGPLVLRPGERTAVPTGIALQLPPGWCALVMARSGLSLRSGVALCNGVGLIDSDYRGEILVALENRGSRDFVIEDGMRVAQLLCLPAPSVRLVEKDALDPTARGAGGFGSTGLGTAPGENDPEL